MHQGRRQAQGQRGEPGHEPLCGCQGKELERPGKQV